MSETVFILNGPNLNMLGVREPDIYGHTTLADIEEKTHLHAQSLGLDTIFRQTNHEGTLVDWIQQAYTSASGIIINPGAYTHTSVALHDALKGTGLPVIEVHLSNIFAREPFRHHSYVSPLAAGIICGLGDKGYVLALDALRDILDRQASA